MTVWVWAARHSQDAYRAEQIVEVLDSRKPHQLIDSGLRRYPRQHRRDRALLLPRCSQDGRDDLRYCMLQSVLELLHCLRRCGKEGTEDVIFVRPVVAIAVKRIDDSIRDSITSHADGLPSHRLNTVRRARYRGCQPALYLSPRLRHSLAMPAANPAAPRPQTWHTHPVTSRNAGNSVRKATASAM